MLILTNVNEDESNPVLFALLVGSPKKFDKKRQTGGKKMEIDSICLGACASWVPHPY